MRIDTEDKAAPPQYFAVEACSRCGILSVHKSDRNCSAIAPEARCGAHPQLVRKLAATDFYRTLLEHTMAWQSFHTDVTSQAIKIIYDGLSRYLSRHD